MQILLGVGLALAPMFSGSARDGADESPDRETPIPVEVKVEGAVLAYVPREIPRAKRTPGGEIEFIEEATAVLRVSRPIAFRRVSLDAGEYILRVASEEKRGHALVLEAMDAREEKKPGAARPADERAPRRGVEKTAFGAEGEAEPEGAAGRDRPGQAGAEAAPKPAKNRTRERKGEEETVDARAPRPAPLLRVPLTVSSREKSADALSFDLKVSSKGTKLRIVIRAGATEARASLRLEEPDTGP
jgi:hypothetical protein